MFCHECGYVNTPKTWAALQSTEVFTEHRGVLSVTSAQVVSLSEDEDMEIYQLNYWVQSGWDSLR